MRIIIYRVVADQGPYVSAWRLTKAECKALIKWLQNDAQARMFFGTNYHIEMADLQFKN